MEFELLERKDAYLLFLAVGGDVEKLPKPLNAVEVKLYDLCVDKANTNAYEEEESVDTLIEVPTIDIGTEDTAMDLVTKLMAALEKNGIIKVCKKPPDVTEAKADEEQEPIKQE
jgi:hypothetical protein